LFGAKKLRFFHRFGLRGNLVQKYRDFFTVLVARGYVLGFARFVRTSLALRHGRSYKHIRSRLRRLRCFFVKALT
ncbi:MAG: hypothetical protein ACI3ZP_11520, partial [Candidatus Cryptobacteroides sp.]